MLLLTFVLLLASEKEIAMGRAINAELRRHAAAIDDEQIIAYAVRIADRFREQSPLPLSVEVTSNRNKRQVSALTGGFLRIPVGAILHSESEVDFARAVAHAVAHFAKRHHVVKRDAGDATIPLIFMDNFLHGDDELGPRPNGFQQIKKESEADALASQWTMDYEATGDFEAIRQRATQLTAAPTRRKPTLKRASEQ